MSVKVRKAVIPAAGLGTRFLPATKALAKEMLPIVDKPTIQFIVEEAKASGIEDILIVEGKQKRSIEDHFDSAPELEQNLKEKHKDALLQLVHSTTDIGVNLFFVRQPYPRGLGDAVRLAKSFVGDEPFVVMLGDDLMNDKVPLTKQLIDEYDKTHASILAVKRCRMMKYRHMALLIRKKKFPKASITLRNSLKSQPLPMPQVTWLSLAAIC